MLRPKNQYARCMRDARVIYWGLNTIYQPENAWVYIFWTNKKRIREKLVGWLEIGAPYVNRTTGCTYTAIYWVKSFGKCVFERGIQWNQNKKLCLETLSWEKHFFLNFFIFWAKSRISYTRSSQWVLSLEESVSERGVQWNQNKKLCLKTLSWEKHFFLKFLHFLAISAILAILTILLNWAFFGNFGCLGRLFFRLFWSFWPIWLFWPFWPFWAFWAFRAFRAFWAFWMFWAFWAWWPFWPFWLFW